MTAAVRHRAGIFSGGVQPCMRCHTLLVDYRNSVWTGGDDPPGGWEPGAEIVVLGPMSTLAEAFHGPAMLCESTPLDLPTILALPGNIPPHIGGCNGFGCEFVTVACDDCAHTLVSCYECFADGFEGPELCGNCKAERESRA